MKSFILISRLFLLLSVHAYSQNLKTASSEPVAVIELFTSQGCSSCPAADDLLNETIENARQNNKKIYGLSFHVSYWNHLGWKDPYSSEQFTQRQKDYAIPGTSIYTPQMFANGQYEFVGSNKDALQKSISMCLEAAASYTISATSSIADSKVTIHYTLDNAPQTEIINIAIVEPTVENFVPRGENKGKTLKHYNVVTKFATQKAQQDEVIALTLPKTKSPNREAILYIQDPKTLVIKGASRIVL